MGINHALKQQGVPVEAVTFLLQLLSLRAGSCVGLCRLLEPPSAAAIAASAHTSPTCWALLGTALHCLPSKCEAWVASKLHLIHVLSQVVLEGTAVQSTERGGVCPNASKQQSAATCQRVRHRASAPPEHWACPHGRSQYDVEIRKTYQTVSMTCRMIW